ncbi:MAG: amidohydrolase [Hyphomonadaceae bacterium]|nr:amidohydrolase [Hyphomonadaceae bacterium]
MIVDAHCHASDVWFEPIEPLVFQMDQNGVAHAVLTQLLGQFDNAYQQRCLARYPGRLASCVAVDPAAPDALAQVRALAAGGASGLRLRPDARSPGDDPLAIWRTAQEAGMAISCGGPAPIIAGDAFAELVGALPGLTIAVEHLGGWSRPDCDKSEEAKARILALAKFPNVCLKVPALGQLAQRGPMLPPSGRVLPLEGGKIVLEMLRAFGPERLMWGSDSPVVGSREGYANSLNWTREIFAAESAAAIDLVFGGTARTVFRLG